MRIFQAGITTASPDVCVSVLTLRRPCGFVYMAIKNNPVKTDTSDPMIQGTGKRMKSVV